jgi:hypothetical protein
MMVNEAPSGCGTAKNLIGGLVISPDIFMRELWTLRAKVRK